MQGCQLATTLIIKYSLSSLDVLLLAAVDFYTRSVATDWLGLYLICIEFRG